MFQGIDRLIAALVVCACAAVAAAIDIETVPVGNAGNAGELSGRSVGGCGDDRVCGAVDYTYGIGTYEVTAGQYAAFLNAVAATDTYSLYNEEMSFWPPHPTGCHIQRAGSWGSYTYSVDAEWADRPVNLVSWGDAARFANWVHNGQPVGSQGPGTTETGSYTLNGATSHIDLMAVERAAGATWVIPTEDEWYKAAYHKNDGATANYWTYGTASDVQPSNVLTSPDPGNNANFFDTVYTVDAPYFTSEVGSFENSAGPYGTYDQVGNVTEWTEKVASATSRGGRGTNFAYGPFFLGAGGPALSAPASLDLGFYGFRVVNVQVPEPGSLLFLMLGGLTILRRR